MTTMKAIVIERPGGPEQLKLREIDRPMIKPGWSLVKVQSFGINRSEIFTRLGLSPSVSFPRVLGIECTGVIVETSDAKRLPKGQRIISIMGEMGRAFDGSYAEYVLLPNTQIYPVQTDLKRGDLAAIPETGYTAYGSLVNMRLYEGAKILIRGATSGVGITALKMIRKLYPSAHLTGTTRKPEKAGSLFKAGFDEVVLDQEGTLKTAEKYERILELIGPATLKDSFRHIAPGGIVCSTGQLGGQWTMNDFDPIMDIPDGALLTSFYSGNVTDQRIQGMLDFIKRERIDMRPEKVFHGLEAVPDAHRYLESAKSFGKVVIVLD
ncbi:zinc-binding dehydrogenase [Catenisphaera adipataccumulans]|jgi:NADPH2:quinone reductase|uniref:NADPH:quinone reductase-like Zn-dependent oxidoreductase n=1 Tax=Catenisphaera adipataccumulans TaxID=700500 RepID=A0A7W8CXA0_9FIRM|nr:zinc-binding dehydrogenase [Catenisphaera adipataccumulans]MBB5183315.1 NADPH:quinone reductase-like Zn-dependent oxidoreductase [Catenisphaera adipataccumulans]